MANIKLSEVTKVYPGGVTAVENFSLDIEDKEFVIFVGPSGCGKSTTLRMIAGLEEITSGDIYIGDSLVNDAQPKDRDIAMVFQSYALYPHMTVYKNMAFSLKMRKVPKYEIDKSVRATAAVLGISHLLERKPRALSGGERQRVALGRAMVRSPKAFLLDEPLSNLDAKLRTDMRAEIIRLHKELQSTFIYVTHDQTEAMTMGDRIVIMDKGRILQVDTPKIIYNYPVNIFVAGFIGSPQMNFMSAAITEDGSYLELECGLKISVSSLNASPDALAAYVGRTLTAGIRPEHITITAGDTVDATVDFSEMLGAETYIHLEAGGKALTARAFSSVDLQRGRTVGIGMSGDKIHLFDSDTGFAITGVTQREEAQV